MSDTENRLLDNLQPKTPSQIITAAIEKTGADAGAVIASSVVDAWRELKRTNMGEFERLRRAAMTCGARGKAIDECVREKKPHRDNIKSRSSTFSTINNLTQHGISTNTLQSSTNHPESSTAEAAFLVYEDDRGQHLEKHSLAADLVAGRLRGRLAWCGSSANWAFFRGTHWEHLEQDGPAMAVLSGVLDTGAGDLGYLVSYFNGVLGMIKHKGILPLPELPTGYLPFQNGLLNLATRQLEPVTPGHSLDWCLPYAYDPRADCPAIKGWLDDAAGQSAIPLLRAFAAAALRGITRQKFLLLTGPGGTGKGTFIRLISAMLGAGNVAQTDLQALENNQFETSKFIGKRLITISDTSKFGGSIDKLKALTGGDALRIERKHAQQTGSFIYGGAVLLASNEPIQTTDHTSGLERRRLVVEFSKRVSASQLEAWAAQGGEDAVLHREIPGFVNWLLALSDAEIRGAIDHPHQATLQLNLEHARSSNSVLDWMLTCTLPDPQASAQIGTKIELRSPIDGRVTYDRCDQWLYASYLAFMLGIGRKPVSQRTFSATVVDMMGTLGFHGGKTRRPGVGSRDLQGIKLLQPGDKTDPLAAWTRTADPSRCAGLGADCADSVLDEKTQVVDCAECAGLGGAQNYFYTNARAHTPANPGVVTVTI